MMGQWWVRSQDWVDVHMVGPLFTFFTSLQDLEDGVAGWRVRKG